MNPLARSVLSIESRPTWRTAFARRIRRYAGRAMRFADRLEFPGLRPSEIRKLRTVRKFARQEERARLFVAIAEPVDYSPGQHARSFPAVVPAEIPAYLRSSCRNCGCRACEQLRCGPVCTYGDW